MGSRSSTPAYSGPRKKVVIVGASFAGDKIAKGLIVEDHDGKALEILLIDRSQHFENFCGNYKMFVDECFVENSILFDDQMAHYGSSHISFKHGRLTNVLAEENAIEVEVPDGSTEKVSYDVLVLATGGSYQAPWRADDSKLPTFEQRQKECEEFRQKVLTANRILCVGAGSTGLEVAGYTKELYPEKTVGICHKGDVILSDLPGCHDTAKQILTELDIEIYHNTPFSEELRSQWDVVIDCKGMLFLGPQMYLKDKLAECIDKRTGQIFVNEYCQMTNKHPLIEKGQPSIPTVYKNIFSVGDVCLTKMNEQKSIPAIIQYKHVVIENIYSTVTERPLQAMLDDEINLVIMIPIGRTRGIMKFNRMMNRDATMFREKEKLIGLENGARANKLESIQAQQKMNKQFGVVLGVAQGCCKCLPMHISKNRDVVQKQNAQDREAYERYY